MTIGEIARRVDRMELAMDAGFQTVRDEIRRLNFVPAAVYAADRMADRDRLTRLERDLADEVDTREKAATGAAQRAWQSRWSLIVALLGVPLSVLGAVGTALIINQLHG